MTEEEFVKEVTKLGITVTKEELLKLTKYYNMLIEWNAKINLTRITSPKDVYLKHFYDSLTLVKAIDLTKITSLCDIGSGAGFPGIVLKIFYPNLSITLLDSLNKRVIFLNEVIKELALKDIKALHSRSEDYHGTFDLITARAVANLSNLIPYINNLMTKNNTFIAMKANIDQELEVAKPILAKYHLEVTRIVTFNLPYEESLRNLLVIKKI